MKTLNFIISVTLSAIIFSCTEDDPELFPVVATTFTNLPADPGTGINPNTGQPTGTTRKFALFSFATGDIVAGSDSTSANWDLGFNSTTIIVNSATSGPGNTQAQVINGIFDELMEAPEAGYKSDSDPAPIAGAPNSNLAIPTGSAQGWYTYDGASMTIRPTAGRVILIKTGEGKYAKMEIISYYKDAPPAPAVTDMARYYTFRYVYQPNDTRSFK